MPTVGTNAQRIGKHGCLAPGCKRPIAAGVASKLPAGINLTKNVFASNILCFGHARHIRDLAQ